MVKKVFMIAGESSGDMLGSKMIREFIELSHSNPDYKFIFSGVGGQLMQKHKFLSIFPMEDLSIMGIFEILPHIPKLINRINFTVEKIIEFKPDYIITIDSPDFCFRVMKKLKKFSFFNEVKKIHLIAPSVWAYRESRAQKVAKLYNLLLAILPFEPPYFEKYGLKTKFIGHPIIEDNPSLAEKESLRSAFFETYQIKKDNKIILLTPGSRIGEVKKIFPEFIKAINMLKNNIDSFVVVIPVVKKTQKIIEKLSSNILVPFKIIDSSQKRLILASADYAIAKSGTNSVEISLYKIPQIITYKINFLTHQIIKRMVKIKHANLLNIIAKREIIPELLQKNCNSQRIYDEMLKLVNNEKLAKTQIDESQESLKSLGLGNIDNPMKIAVTEIIKS
ncbi:MAG: lipid-A-disaccharide synthase [Alphaproteobacteria bacterium]|nr:lipid-A-disaccharide synthase [Alphaproteobacteria bacterium]